MLRVAKHEVDQTTILTLQKNCVALNLNPVLYRLREHFFQYVLSSGALLRPSSHTHTHLHTHRSPTRTGPCTLNAVGLLSSDVETRGLPPLAPPPRVCGEVYLTLPYPPDP